MKAPDKIFIQTYVDEAFSSKWTTIPFRDFENTEYIRKDALLELLKPEQELPFLEEYERGCLDGRNRVKEELLDKINSL